jgi:type VI protein secretion system component VasK
MKMRRQAHQSTSRATHSGDDCAPMQTTIEGALQSLQAQKNSHQPEGLYQIPWFLVASNRQSLASEFLKSAFSCSSSFRAPEETAAAEIPFWRWWLFNKLVAIELDTRIFVETKADSGQRAWACSLQLLRKHRSRLAANGFLLVVSALDLTPEAKGDIRLFGQNARILVNDLSKRLHLEIPVYLVVTECDKLPGFKSFLGGIPESVLKQAVGIRFSVSQGEMNSDRQKADVEKYFSRLHAVMLGMLKEEKDFSKKKQLFKFFQNWQARKTALDDLAEILFESNPAQAPLNWRGLYWVGGEEQPAFLDDLFNRFLPVDQPLAKRV